MSVQKPPRGDLVKQTNTGYCTYLQQKPLFSCPWAIAATRGENSKQMHQRFEPQQRKSKAGFSFATQLFPNVRKSLCVRLQSSSRGGDSASALSVATDVSRGPRGDSSIYLTNWLLEMQFFLWSGHQQDALSAGFTPDDFPSDQISWSHITNTADVCRRPSSSSDLPPTFLSCDGAFLPAMTIFSLRPPTRF